MKKRLLSFLTAVCLVITMIPTAAFADSGEIDEYTAPVPQAPILNAINGCDKNYIKDFVVDYYYYNTFDEFKNDTQKSYISGKYKKGAFYWNNFGTSVLGIMSNSGELKIGLAGTFNNDVGHTHKKGVFSKYTMNPYAAVSLQNGSKYLAGLSGGFEAAYANSSTRLGDAEYVSLPGDYGQNKNLNLTFSTSKINYNGDSYCEHDYGSVQYTTVTFMDKTYPTIKEVYLTGGSDNKNFKAEDKIQVHIVFSEAMRFADNSAKHKDTYVNILPDGVTAKSETGALRADLKSLKCNQVTETGYYGDYYRYYSEAVFEYTVPSGDTDITIASIDLSPLEKDCPLYFSGSGWSQDNCFNAEVVYNAKGYSGYGYKTAQSVFTDIAGNSFLDFGTVSVTGYYIDCCSPKIIEISASADTKNTSLKDTKKTYGITTSSKNYKDASDNYLGTGDAISFTAYFDEVLNWNDSDVTKIKAETNLKKGGSSVVIGVSTAKGAYGSESGKGSQYGKGYSDGKVSYVNFDPLTITSDMTCSDSNGQIKIKKIYFDGTEVFDFSANEYVDGNKDIQYGDGSDKKDTVSLKGQYYLDNVAPTLATISGAEGVLRGESNSADGFYYGVKISDTRKVSSTIVKSNSAGDFLSYVSGTFKLTNNALPDEKFDYKWAVSALANPGSLNWKNAKSRDEIPFEEFENCYFFISFYNDSVYNLSELELSIKVSDAPGNVSDWYTFTVPYTLDNVGPSLSFAEASRTVAPGTGIGTLSVAVKATDPSGFSTSNDSQVMYQWLDSEDATPEESSWVKAAPSGTYTEGNKDFTATAVQTVSPSGIFSGYLAVRMTDMWGNETLANAGQFKYDLRAPAHDLNYSSDIHVNKAQVKLTNLQSDAAVLILSRTNEMKDGGTELWFLNYTEANTDNLLSFGSRLVSVEENGGYYTFTNYEGGNPWSGYLINGQSNTLHGELYVKVLTGNKAAFTTSEAAISYANVNGAGSQSYPVYSENFTIKVSGRNNAKDITEWLDIDTAVNGEGLSNNYNSLVGEHGYEVLTTSGSAILSDLTRVTVSLDICDKIMPSWGIDSIDFDKSFLRVYRKRYSNYSNKNTFTSSDYKEIPLQALKSQIVNIPKYVTEKLGSGIYSLSFKLTMKNGFSGEVALPETIQVDTTPVSSGANIGKYYFDLKGSITDESYIFDKDAPTFVYENAYDPGIINIDRASVYSDEPGSEGINTIIIPVSKTVVPADLSPQNTGAGGFGTRLYVYVDDYERNYNAISWLPEEELITGVSWVKITNTVGGNSIEKWILVDNSKYSNHDEYGYYSELLFYQVDTASELLNVEDDFVGDDSISLAVVRNMLNKLTFEVYALNGRVSSPRTMYIMPKSDPVTGSVSNVSMSHNNDKINDTGTSLKLAKDLRTVFTPVDGTDTSNLRAFINFSYNDGQWHPDYEMSLSQDGTFFYIDRDPSIGHDFFYDGKIFYIMLLNTETGYISYQLSSYNSSYNYYMNSIRDREAGIKFDTDAPVISECQMSDKGGGNYELSFKVKDKVLEEGGEISLTFRPTSDYKTALDVGDGEIFTYTIAKGQNNNWSLGTSTGRLGIYEINVETGSYDDATVTVKGVVPSSSTLENKKIPAGFDIDVKDRFDNASTVNISENVVSHEPVVTASNSTVSTGRDFKLYIDFNQPVMMSKSWICQNPSGYGTHKVEEVPITADTSGTVSVLDVFGNTHDAKYNVQNVFDFSSIGYGVDVEFTTTELVKGVVGITVKRHDMNRGYPEIIYANDPYDKEKATKTIYAAQNGWFEFKLYSRNEAYYKDQYNRDGGKSLWVYVGNIANTAPEAELYFYFDELKQGYKESELPNLTSDGSYSTLTTSGYVNVSYTTEREVAPADGNSGSARFSYIDGTDGAYTFEYVDTLGNVGSKSFKLSDYGIVLEAPPIPPVDNEAPLISGYIYSKEGSAYINRASFSEATSPSAISASMNEIGYVQGYKMVLNTYDTTSTKTVIRASDPGNLSYSSNPASGEITGVTLKGNTVYVDPTASGSFWIAVVDNAVAETSAASDHTTRLEIPVITDCFDTKAPTADITSKYTSLYSVDYFVELMDTNNADRDITSEGEIVLYSNELEGDGKTPGGHPKYKYTFNENKSLDFSYVDMAGNIGASNIKVDNLDTNPPTLTETWSPGAKLSDNGITKIDSSLPPNYVINTDLKLKIDSDKGIKNAEVYVMASNYRPDENHGKWTLVDEDYQGDVVNSVIIGTDSINIVFDKDGESYYGGWAKVVVTGYNGRVSTHIAGFPNGTIDAWPIEFIVTAEPVIKTGFSDPYGYKIKIYPTTKECYCNNESAHTDDNGVTTRTMYCCYDPDDPFGGNTGYEATIYTNTDYTWKFTDLAGNTASVKINMPDSAGGSIGTYEYSRTDYSSNEPLYDSLKKSQRQQVALKYIDKNAPEITLTPGADDLAAMGTIGSSGVNISVKTDEACTLKYSVGSSAPVTTSLSAGGSTVVNFNTNGVFTFTATDNTGNSSIKSVTIGNIDNTPPVIVFDESTVSIRQDSSAEELKALLDSGVSAYDLQRGVKTDLTFTYDQSSVKLTEIGLYEVTYKAVDSVGNITELGRFVEVYDKNLPGITLDGKPAKINGLSVVRPGNHIITVTNLKEITAGEQEPYNLYVRTGVYKDGQMKGTQELVKVSASGSVYLEDGYYTIYVITQSRKSFRTMLYVQK